MKQFIENIWGFTNYMRGNSSSSEIMDLVLTCVFLFRHKPTLIEEIERLTSKQYSDEELMQTFFESDNSELSFYGLEDVALLIEEELKKLDQTDELSGVLSALSVLHTIKRAPKSRYFFIESQSGVKFNGYGLNNISQKDYENLFSILLEMFESSYRNEIYLTPPSIQKLQNELIPNSESVFDPAVGVGTNFSNYLQNFGSSCFGIEKNQRTWAFAKLRYAYRNQVHIELGDSLSNSKSRGQKFNNVITTPPFGSRVGVELLEDKSYIKYGTPHNRNSDFLWLQLALDNLKEDGLALITMPMSSTFRSSARDLEIKANLVKSNKVVGLIALPPGIFQGAGLHTVIWVLSHKLRKDNRVLFVNASDESMSERKNRQTSLTEDSITFIGETFLNWIQNGFFKAPSHLANLIDISVVEKNDFNLTPSAYLEVKELKGFDFSDTVELGDLIITARGVRNQNDSLVKKISVKNLIDDGVDLNINTDELDFSERSRSRVFKGNILLVSRIGNKLKPTFLKQKDGELYDLLNVYGFIINTKVVLVDYLILELRKEYVKLQLKGISSGNSIPFFKSSDLLKIRVRVPSQIEQQQKIVDRESEIISVTETKKAESEKKFLELKNQWVQNLGSKKHNILQPLNNAALQLEVILEWIDMNDGKIDVREDFPFKQGESPLSNLQSIKYSLTKSIEYANNLTNEVDFGVAQKINVIKKIREHLANKNCQSNITICTTSNKDKIEFTKPDGGFINIEPIVEISELGIEQIVNNIWENANRHGFVDHNRSYRFAYEFKQQTLDNKEGFYLEISFANNGKPFPKGMGTLKRFITQGEKAGKTGNTGEGGARIYEIIKHFNGELEVYDEPSSEFPVEFKIFFPLIIENEEV